jgi:SAM-dependent methyltransferase
VPLEELIGACLDLGAAACGGPLSRLEASLVSSAVRFDGDISRLRRSIAAGEDPLGEAYRGLRSVSELRAAGAFFTPCGVVAAMTEWALDNRPDRVVDAGCGSGRFAAEVARRAPTVEVVAVDIDPVATLMCRAALAVIGAPRVRVLQADYTTADLGSIAGRTVFLGNPPYVRHHELLAASKAWAIQAAARHSLPRPGLAGLHVHFVLATLDHARPGDACAVITSAQWLDARYGATVRAALTSRVHRAVLHLFDPASATFDGAMTTAVIACFEVGAAPGPVSFHRVEDGVPLAPLDRREISRDPAALAQTDKWSSLFEPENADAVAVADGRSGFSTTTTTTSALRGFVPLGEIARVSRGVATGCNDFFVLSPSEAAAQGLEPWVVPALTRAREVFEARGVVRAGWERKLLLCPGHDIDLSTAPALRDYLRRGEGRGVHTRYLCSHRRPWWHLRAVPAPVVATYMARRPPAFALNPDGLICLNVVHGLHPKVELTLDELAALVEYLNAHRASHVVHGRIYQGGLIKLEPREMERILVPSHLIGVCTPSGRSR